MLNFLYCIVAPMTNVTIFILFYAFSLSTKQARATCIKFSITAAIVLGLIKLVGPTLHFIVLGLFRLVQYT